MLAYRAAWLVRAFACVGLAPGGRRRRRPHRADAVAGARAGGHAGAAEHPSRDHAGHGGSARPAPPAGRIPGFGVGAGRRRAARRPAPGQPGRIAGARAGHHRARPAELRAGPAGAEPWIRRALHVRHPRHQAGGRRYSGLGDRRAGAGGELPARRARSHRGAARPVGAAVRQCRRWRDRRIHRPGQRAARRPGRLVGQRCQPPGRCARGRCQCGRHLALARCRAATSSPRASGRTARPNARSSTRSPSGRRGKASAFASCSTACRNPRPRIRSA